MFIYIFIFIINRIYFIFNYFFSFLFKPSAVRNIILIRHGQYVTSAITDKARILTPLGRRQAEATGKRLQV